MQMFHRCRPALAVNALLAICVALSGCAGGPAPRAGIASPVAAEPKFPGIPPSAAVAVAYPTVIDGFTFGSLEASEDAASGTRLRYHSHAFPELILDAFAYMVGFTDQTEAVLDDFENSFAEYMAGAVQQGHYKNYVHRDTGRIPIQFPFGSREGVWQLFDISTEHMELVSLTYLFYRPPFAVKIRASHPPSITADMLRRHVDHFAEQLVPGLTIRNQRGCDQPVQIEVSKDVETQALSTAIAQSLLQRGMQGCADYDLARQLTEGLITAPGASDGTATGNRRK